MPYLIMKIVLNISSYRKYTIRIFTGKFVGLYTKAGEVI